MLYANPIGAETIWPRINSKLLLFVISDASFATGGDNTGSGSVDSEHENIKAIIKNKKKYFISTSNIF